MVVDEKIPCVVLIYYCFDIIRESLEFLISDGRFAIYVLENSSINSDKEIRPYLIDKLKKGHIEKYVLFKRNISNNAYQMFFDSNILNSKSKYILITDGDLVVQPNQFDKDWLEEEISIIEKYPDIESCAINLSPDNLPTQHFDTSGWHPDQYGKHYDDFVAAGTGIHLLLMKSNFFREFLSWRRLTKNKFLDSNINHFLNLNKKKWVITKHNYAIHLTWTIYNDLNHPYTQLKINRSYEQIWKHFDYCGFHVYSQKGKKYYYPWLAFKNDIKRVMPFLPRLKLLLTK